MLKSVLDALERGRLIELPGNDKKDVLQLLASVLEAVPSIPAGTDLVGAVLSHENQSNTSFGSGWACPHARVSFDGELMCAIGWSPKGIDYGKAGDLLVRLVVMYVVPENQRTAYLKEISSLARAIKTHPEFQSLENIQDLNIARNRLLDMVHVAVEGSVTDARARMIQLKTRATALSEGIALEGMIMEPLTVITGPGITPIVLTQNKELSDLVQEAGGIATDVANKGRHEVKGWFILRRSSAIYQGERVVYECLAIRAPKQ